MSQMPHTELEVPSFTIDPEGHERQPDQDPSSWRSPARGARPDRGRELRRAVRLLLR
jgi:hypothetical protein